jgi:molybdopterin-guanine dinucleotide biosynthesis protein A
MISAALMAGGKSIRMGQDKCLIRVKGVPLWRRQLNLLLEVSTDAFVVAPARPHWLPDNLHWVPDAVQDKGPIGGLAAALAHASNNKVLVLAVDMPAMSSTFLKQLAAMASHSGGVIPQIGESYEPLCAIYPHEALPAIREQLLVRGDYSLQTLVRDLMPRGLMQSFCVPAAEAGLFRNWNFPSDCTGELD